MHAPCATTQHLTSHRKEKPSQLVTTAVREKKDERPAPNIAFACNTPAVKSFRPVRHTRTRRHHKDVNASQGHERHTRTQHQHEGAGTSRGCLGRCHTGTPVPHRDTRATRGRNTPHRDVNATRGHGERLTRTKTSQNRVVRMW
jgi:mannose-6-phosphate isomerase class I